MILDIPKNALRGNQQNGKIEEFKLTLSQQLSQNSTHTSTNSNTFTQILKEVLNNDNNIEPKTVNESSDSNRSITYSGETIHLLSKPVLCLDGEYMDMGMNVDNVNKHVVMNDKNSITFDFFSLLLNISKSIDSLSEISLAFKQSLLHIVVFEFSTFI